MKYIGLERYEWAKEFAKGQRQFVRHRGQSEKELDAFEIGCEQGYLKALADLAEQKIITFNPPREKKQ